MDKKKHEYRPGANKEFGFTTRTGARMTVQVNELRDLPDERLIVALKRFKAVIEGGAKLSGYDDTTIGAKNTECTWGLCLEDKGLWPDAKDHIFPYDFLNEGRTSPLGHPTGTCPMDKRSRQKKDPNGCFWTCRFFHGPRPSRSEYLQMIDRKIDELDSEE